jgi:predicted acyltransferase
MEEPNITTVKSKRLLSLDVFRGFIMIMLASAGFGILQFSKVPESAPVWESCNYALWQKIGFCMSHPPWISHFYVVGVTFWDLIQPAFMFMVGVAMPYSYASRARSGQSERKLFLHALWRSFLLVILGVFLASKHTMSTTWQFTNVLAQIGLGYTFLYLMMSRSAKVKIGIFAAILIGYWLFFALYTVPEDFDYAAVKAVGDTVLEGRFAPWSKNANAAIAFDRWFLNLFPQPGSKPFVFNGGGYATLNFIPSIATMMLGVFSGQLLRTQHNPRRKLGLLIGLGATCMVLALLFSTVCPIVKRIWTPSWVLFCGAHVIWMLAFFYWVFDLLPMKEKLRQGLAFPFIVIGMNSIAIYMLSQLMHPWICKTVRTHLGGFFETLLGEGILAKNMYGRPFDSIAAFIVLWLIALWMYKRRIFIKV